MNRIQGCLALAATTWLLTACGGGSDDNGGAGAAPLVPAAPVAPVIASAKVTVDELATGAYQVSIGDLNAPTVGKYYAGADGRRLLALEDATDLANPLYRRDAGGSWLAVPGVTQDKTVSLLRSDALVTAAVDAATLAGSYVVQVATGVVASFSIDASGKLSAGSSNCKLSGQLTAGTLPNTRSLNLTASACGSLPDTSSGVLAVDSDLAPASFRLLADNGSKIVDLWAFKE